MKTTINETDLRSLKMTIVKRLLATIAPHFCGAGADLDAISEVLEEIGMDRSSIEAGKLDDIDPLGAREAAQRMRDMGHGLVTAGNAIMGTCSVVMGLCDAPASQPEEPLEEVLLLDTWEVTEGFGKIDTIVCPHCRAEYSVNQFAQHEVKRFTCPACKKSATVRTVQTAQGRAWITDAEVADGKAGGA